MFEEPPASQRKKTRPNRATNTTFKHNLKKTIEPNIMSNCKLIQNPLVNVPMPLFSNGDAKPRWGPTPFDTASSRDQVPCFQWIFPAWNKRGRSHLGCASRTGRWRAQRHCHLWGFTTNMMTKPLKHHRKMVIFGIIWDLPWSRAWSEENLVTTLWSTFTLHSHGTSPFFSRKTHFAIANC